jgi:FAD/FMN-containing dehydrogenase
MASILDVIYLTLIFLTSTISAWPQTKNICRILESRLPERVSFPTDAAYNASLHSYYAEQEREISPGCIFRPFTTAEVSQFVKLVNEVSRRGQSNYTEPIFAIRGGGHTLFSGAANLDGGVTVDLRLMNSMVLSKDKRMASLGGGSIWSNVYPQLVVHNLTVLGGRVPGIGVGGFTLGGMYESAIASWCIS